MYGWGGENELCAVQFGSHDGQLVLYCIGTQPCGHLQHPNRIVLRSILVVCSKLYNLV